MTGLSRVLGPARLALGVLCAASGLVAWAAAGPAQPPAAVAVAQEGGGQVREVRVVAHRYAYTPSRIDVQEGDLLKVTLETEDIPHSFTIDDPYRIAKRATRGRPVVFEFRADQAGTYTYYCNLTAEDGCRAMRGELVVRPRR